VKKAVAIITVVVTVGLAASGREPQNRENPQHPENLENRDLAWPINGGVDNIRYSPLTQINRDNVSRLKVAWTYDSHDAFKASEMQSNPVVVDGVLFVTTPTLKVVAVNAATGAEIWRFDPSGGAAPGARFRHRGVTVHKDRVFVSYRSYLYALDRKTGTPITSFGSGGRIDLREGLGMPPEKLSVSASTPGVVFEDMLIMGSSVPETIPGSPGHIRAFDVNSGRLRWIFHTIPQPGEFGYDTWSKDAYKLSGGANAWAGVTVDAKNAMVFAATGSASFDFYGVTRHGDNLFADCVLALDARTGKRVWHFQGIKHDVWDYDFPASPNLITVTRGGRKVDAVAQITKYGYVYVLNRRTGEPLFPIESRKVPPSAIDGERLSERQPYPVKPPPFTRQGFTEDMITTRTPEAHADVLARFKKYSSGFFAPPSFEGTIIFPGVDGGAEWGGAAFDPDSALLYVNSNEMPWIVKLIPNNDTSLYNSKCATCHREDRKGSPSAPSHPRRDCRAHPPGHRPDAGVPRHGGAQHQRRGRVPDHRRRQGKGSEADQRSQLAEVPQRRREHLPRSRWLPGDHAALGRADRARSQRRHDPLEDSVRRVSRAGGQGADQHRQRQLRRPRRHCGRAAVHRRDQLRQEVPRLRQAHRHAAMGDDAAGGWQRDAVHLHHRRQAVRRHRLRRRQERRTVGQQHRGLRAAMTVRSDETAEIATTAEMIFGQHKPRRLRVLRGLGGSSDRDRYRTSLSDQS
jgi:outer membrane protein assembly factor BamB